MSYFNQAIETMPLDKLRALQNEKLKILVQNMYQHIPFYKQAFDEKGITPNDIQRVEDLHILYQNF